MQIRGQRLPALLGIPAQAGNSDSDAPPALRRSPLAPASGPNLPQGVEEACTFSDSEGQPQGTCTIALRKLRKATAEPGTPI